MQQLNKELSGSLKRKGRRSPLQPQPWQAYYSQLPCRTPSAEIHALLLTECREEARNRNLGMLRSGQATDIFPSWAAQGANTGPAKSH